MSTRVEFGYKVDLGGRSPFDLLREARAVLEPVYVEAYRMLAVRLAVLDLDRSRRREAPAPLIGPGTSTLLSGTALAHAEAVLADAHHDVVRAGHRRPALDLTFAVALFDDLVADDVLYALLHCELPRYEQLWAALPGVSSFAYWDHTDRPSDVTAADWDERRAIWRRVLGPTPSSRVSLSWDLLGDDHHEALWLHPTSPELITSLESYIPSVAERALVCARRMVTPGVRSGAAGHTELLEAAALIEPELPALSYADLVTRL